MSKVVATTVLPEDSGEVLTFGDTGDAIAISGDSLNLDVLQDAGGNNIFTSDGAGTLTSVNSAFGGALNLLTTNTFTGTTSSAFTTLIDSTYDVYIFKFININPNTNDKKFDFQASSDGGVGWGVTQTTTFFRAAHAENDGSASLAYDASQDLAQSAAAQPLGYSVGEDADSSLSGTLYLFSPSSTTYMKNYYATTQYQFKNSIGTLEAIESFVGGYFDTTSVVDAVRFQMTSGNMDGEIKMYGISKS